MRPIFWIALGGVAVYLFTRKSEGTAPAVTLSPQPQPIQPSPAGPVASPLNLIQSGQWGCPAGQVFDSGANICVPGVSVAPAYPGGPV